MTRIGQQPQLDIGKPILIYVDIGARTEVVFHIRQPASGFHRRQVGEPAFQESR